MLTRFGKFCRKLRLEKGELLFDMAQRLGVSSAFLSKVENGKAKPPMQWEDNINVLYSLTQEEKHELHVSINEARAKNVININSYNQEDRDMMFAFARKLDSMDENEKDRWKKILKNEL